MSVDHGEVKCWLSCWCMPNYKLWWQCSKRIKRASMDVEYEFHLPNAIRNWAVGYGWPASVGAILSLVSSPFLSCCPLFYWYSSEFHFHDLVTGFFQSMCLEIWPPWLSCLVTLLARWMNPSIDIDGLLSFKVLLSGRVLWSFDSSCSWNQPTVFLLED